MFGINWSDPETLWLNLTNLGLGLCVLGCLAVFAYGVVEEVRERVRRRAESTNMDRAVADLFRGRFDAHVLTTPELGLTMADGGEPVAPKPASLPTQPAERKKR